MSFQVKQKQQFIEHMVRGLIRQVLPIAFDAAGLTEDAEKLRELPEDASMSQCCDAAAAATYAAPAASYAATAASYADAAAAAAYADAAGADAAAAARWVADAVADADHVRSEWANILLAAADAAGLEIPHSDNPDADIWRWLQSTPGIHFDMSTWMEVSPVCGTTCCRAGAVCLAVGGLELAEAFGYPIAGGLIYASSARTAGSEITIPDFYRTGETEQVLAEIETNAKRDQSLTTYQSQTRKEQHDE